MQRIRATIVYSLVGSLLILSVTACSKSHEESTQSRLTVKTIMKFALALLAPLRSEQPNAVVSLEKQAERFLTQNQYEKAEKSYQLALTIRQSGWGAEHLNVVPGLEKLATFYATQNKLTEAETLFHKALAMREKLQGVNHPDIAVTMDAYAVFLRKTHRDTEATVVERRAQVLRGK